MITALRSLQGSPLTSFKLTINGFLSHKKWVC
jgi:hypothetical protein